MAKKKSVVILPSKSKKTAKKSKKSSKKNTQINTEMPYATGA